MGVPWYDHLPPCFVTFGTGSESLTVSAIEERLCNGCSTHHGVGLITIPTSILASVLLCMLWPRFVSEPSANSGLNFAQVKAVLVTYFTSSVSWNGTCGTCTRQVGKCCSLTGHVVCATEAEHELDRKKWAVLFVVHDWRFWTVFVLLNWTVKCWVQGNGTKTSEKHYSVLIFDFTILRHAHTHAHTNPQLLWCE